MSSPVEAIPIERIARAACRRTPAAGARRSAPRSSRCASPSRRRSGAQRRTSSIVQGNGERTSTTSPCAESSRTNQRLRPVVEVARACCPARASRRRGPCSASATAARAAPTRAGGRRAQRAISATRVLGVGHVLEHLDRAWPARTRRRRTAVSAGIARYSRLGACACAHPAWIGSSRSMPTTGASPSALRPACTSTPSPQPTSSTERGAARSNSSSSVALEAAHQPAHDGVGRAVLVVCVAGDAALGGHTVERLAARRPARRLPAPRACAARAGLRAGGAAGRSGSRPARSARARRRAAARSAARARRCAASCTRCAASRSPITPSAHSTTAAMNSTAPRISDCTWPLPLPST